MIRHREGRVLRDVRRGGFTLVEMLVAVAVVGILAGLAIPNMRNVTYRARATNVFGDFRVIQQATLDYNAALNDWPAEIGSGTVPTGLATYLPANFSFSGDGYEFDFENIDVPPGFWPGDPSVTHIIGTLITAPDDELSNAIVELLGGRIVSSVGNSHLVAIDVS